MLPYEHGLQWNTTRARGWCFTINNFSEEEKNQISELICSNAVKYGIAETEHTGDGEGTPHIQGYIYFENAQTFRRIKNLIGERAHIEPAKGNPKQNYDYCSKEGTVFVSKPLNTNSSKFPFLEMHKDMLSMSLGDFEEKYPKEMYLRRDKVIATRFAHATRNTGRFEGDLKERNIWIWGETGLGKSRWAESNGTYNEIYYKNFNKWWDGYDIISTKIVIMEDYPSLPTGDFLAQEMKFWTDRRPFNAECKGSHLKVDPRRFFFIITSNYPIERCFQNPEDIASLKRRFKEIEIKEGDLYNQCIIKLDRNILFQ